MYQYQLKDENVKYYFIAYEYHYHTAENWSPMQILTDKHPLEWLMEGHTEEDSKYHEYRLTFWAEITKELYEKYSSNRMFE